MPNTQKLLQNTKHVDLREARVQSSFIKKANISIIKENIFIAKNLTATVSTHKAKLYSTDNQHFLEDCQ